MLTIASLQVLDGAAINKRSYPCPASRSPMVVTIANLDLFNTSRRKSRTLRTRKPQPSAASRPIPKAAPPKPANPYPIEAEKAASLLKAINQNGWDPLNPPKMKSGHYMDPRELFYRVARVQLFGGFAKAGRDGDRLCELFQILATNYIGRICFRDNGHMANIADDLIQEAVAKCALVVDRFSVWDTKVEPETKLNNAFAYFTTVSRNKMYETLDSPLAGSDVYLEDLKTENQSVADLV